MVLFRLPTLSRVVPDQCGPSSKTSASLRVSLTSILGNTQHRKNHTLSSVPQSSEITLSYHRVKPRRILCSGSVLTSGLFLRPSRPFHLSFCFLDSLGHSSGQKVGRVVFCTLVARPVTHFYPSGCSILNIENLDGPHDHYIHSNNRSTSSLGRCLCSRLPHHVDVDVLRDDGE